MYATNEKLPSYYVAFFHSSHTLFKCDLLHISKCFFEFPQGISNATVMTPELAAENGAPMFDRECLTLLRKMFDQIQPSLVFPCLELPVHTSYDSVVEYLWLLEEFITVGVDILHVDSQANAQWSVKLNLPTTHCRVI